MSENTPDQQFGATSTEPDLHIDPEDDYISEEAVLEDLKSEVLGAVDNKVVWKKVPERPGLELGFSSFIDYDVLQTWLRSCSPGKRKFDGKKFAYLVLTNNSRGIRSKGRDVTVDGVPLTLVSKKWYEEICGKISAQEAIKHTFGKDGHFVSMATELLDEAGYGDVDLESENAPSL